jgi:hypothetical protein
VLGFSIGFCEFQKIRAGKVNALSLANVYFIIFYIVAPLGFIVHYTEISQYFDLRGFYFLGDFLTLAICSVIAYFCLLIGYRVNLLANFRLSIRPLHGMEKYGFLVLVLCVIVLCLIYSLDFDGIADLVSSRLLERHSGYSIDSKTFAFTWKLIPPLTVFMVFWLCQIRFDRSEGQLPSQISSGKYINTIFLVILLFVFVVHGGRGMLFTLSLGCLYIYRSRFRYIPLWTFLVSFLVGLIVVLYGKFFLLIVGVAFANGFDLSDAFAVAFDRFFSPNITSDLTISLLVSLGYGANALGFSLEQGFSLINQSFALDFINSILKQVPLSDFSAGNQAYDNIGIIFSNEIIGNPLFGYAPGLLAAMVVYLDFFGIFVGSFCFGVMLKFTEWAFKNSDSAFGKTFGTYLIIALCGFLSNGIINNLISWHFGVLFLFLVCLPFFSFSLIPANRQRGAFQPSI